MIINRLKGIKQVDQPSHSIYCLNLVKDRHVILPRDQVHIKTSMPEIDRTKATVDTVKGTETRMQSITSHTMYS